MKLIRAQNDHGPYKNADFYIPLKRTSYLFLQFHDTPFEFALHDCTIDFTPPPHFAPSLISTRKLIYYKQPIYNNLYFPEFNSMTPSYHDKRCRLL